VGRHVDRARQPSWLARGQRVRHRSSDAPSGTFNNKLDPVPVEVLELDADRRWGVDDLAQYLLELPKRPQAPSLRPTVPYIGPERPGDAFNAQNTCGDVLEAAGWSFHHDDNVGRHYTRPGKNTKDGASATVYADDGHCIVWTDATDLEVRRSYDPAGLFAHLFHGGDWRAAAQTLRQQGYGAQPVDLSAFIRANYSATDEDEPWPDPQPLDNVGNPPAFPVDVLPGWIADRVHSVAASVSTPVDLPAVLALGALSTACLGRVEIQLKADYVEEANLYIAVALPPSAGKSPVFKRMMAPIYNAERDMRSAMEADIVRATARRDALEKQRRNAENKGSVDEAMRMALEVMEATAAIPKMPQLVSDDATPEAFAELLASNGGRMAIMSTEGGPFEMMAGRYSEGNKSRLEVYLGAWSGDSVRVNRIRRDEPLIIPKALATLVLTVQPTVLENLAEDMRGKGLTARIMYSLPTSQRRIVDSPAEPEDVRRVYEHRLGGLITRMRQFSAPGRINCTDEASRAWITWAQDLYDRAHDGDLRPVAEWVGKVTASVGRTAALLHIADGGEFGALEADTMRRAIAVGDYWVAHALAVHQLWDLDGSGRRAGYILEYVRKKGEPMVKPRDVMAGARSRFPDRESFDAAMAVLEGAGWARLVDGQRGGHGNSKDAPTYQIHPSAVSDCADCAASSAPKPPEKGPTVQTVQTVLYTCVEPSSSSSIEGGVRQDTAPPAQSTQSAQSDPVAYDPDRLL
jgi:replicative DNA helicase